MLTNGLISDGLVVCHRCDNPPCCNPAHLFLGTVGDNARDASSKGRNFQNTHVYPELVQGANNGNALLVDEQVLEIRRAYAAGESNAAELAAKFRVSRALVFKIVAGDAWKHLPVVPVSEAVRHARRRNAQGEGINTARLTTEDVVRIRLDAGAGTPSATLAARHGITQSAVRRVVRRESWAHVP